MKNLLFGIFYCCLSTLSYAQFVNIPDANFRSYLYSIHPECIIGDQLDTTCAGIVNELYVDCNNYSIDNLDGIQYFDNLQYLNASFNQITALPFLPQSGLNYLNVSVTQIQSIDYLPASLETLDVSANSLLTEIVDLPSSLVHFDASVCPQLESPTLNEGLEYVDLTWSEMEVVPELKEGLLTLYIGHNLNMSAFETDYLPSTLKVLDVSFSALSYLPSLPNSLIELRAANTPLNNLESLPPNLQSIHVGTCPNLSSFPDLPISLTSLIAPSCGLSSLPSLHEGLEGLNVAGNQISEIEAFPNSLLSLNLGGNNLSQLPPFPPNLTNLFVAQNNITCWPTFPSTITFMDLQSNPFTCLPNYIPVMGMYPYLEPFGLCNYIDSESNPFGCSTAEGIEGVIYNDSVQDCAYNANEIGISGATVRLFDVSDNQLQVTSCFQDGRYFLLAEQGEYIVRVDTINKPFTHSCEIPGSTANVQIQFPDTLIQEINFGLKCKPGFDIGVSHVIPQGWVFPGQAHRVDVRAGDLSQYFGLNCADGVAGELNVVLSGPITYFGPHQNALIPEENDMTLTYDIQDFGNVNSTDFVFYLFPDTTALAGDEICLEVLVTPTGGDNVLQNNSYDFCYEVVNSYDPNDKQVYPSTVAPGYDDYLTYTINFQNTGSAPAFNIRLEDELSDLVDLTTFEPIGHSHDMNFVLVENDLKIYFPNIMLPDSTTDEAASHGYFQYRIKPLSDLPAGTEIENTAHIFFDFNEAIITNTAVTTFEDIIIGVDDVTLDSGISLFPNPAVDQFYIRTAEDMNILDISIVDQVGRTVDFTESHEGSLLGVQLTDAKAGVYIVTMSTETGVVQERLVLISARN